MEVPQASTTVSGEESETAMSEAIRRDEGIALPNDVRDWLDPYGLLDFRPRPDFHTIRVEDAFEDGCYIVRAELPGIDPEKDVELVVAEGTVTILAERPADRHAKRHTEFRYGAFSRMIRLPATAKEEGITASYNGGVLTVRVPLTEPRRAATRKIPIENES